MRRGAKTSGPAMRLHPPRLRRAPLGKGGFPPLGGFPRLAPPQGFPPAGSLPPSFSGDCGECLVGAPVLEWVVMAEMWELSVPWWEIVLRASVVYFVLLVLLRLSGKRTVGQFTPFDLLVLVLLGDAVQGSMIAGDQSLPGGLILTATLLGWNRLVGFVTARSEGVALAVEGKADILARNGEVFDDALRRADLTLDDLEEAMRDHSVPAVSEIRLAVLEKDGTITVLGKKEKSAGGN